MFVNNGHFFRGPVDFLLPYPYDCIHGFIYLIVLSSPPLKIMSLLYHKQRFEFPVRPSMMRGSTIEIFIEFEKYKIPGDNHHKPKTYRTYKTD